MYFFLILVFHIFPFSGVSAKTLNRKYSVGGSEHRPFFTSLTSDGYILSVDEKFGVIKYDNNFNKMWSKRAVPDIFIDYTYLMAVAESFDGSVFLGGGISTGEETEFGVIFKVNSTTGEIIWYLDHLEDTNESSGFYALIVIGEGENEFLLGFGGASPGDICCKRFVSKIMSNNGTIVWSAYYSGNSSCTGIGSYTNYLAGNSIYYVNENIFLMEQFGRYPSSKSPHQNTFAVLGLMDMNGESIWEGSMGIKPFPDYDCRVEYLIITDDGSIAFLFMMCWWADYPDPADYIGSPIFLIKLDLETKDIIWNSMNILNQTNTEFKHCSVDAFEGETISELKNGDILVFARCYKEISEDWYSYPGFMWFSGETGELKDAIYYPQLSNFYIKGGKKSNITDDNDNYNDGFIYYIESYEEGIVHIIQTDEFILPCEEDGFVFESIMSLFIHRIDDEISTYGLDFYYERDVQCINQVIWDMVVTHPAYHSEEIIGFNYTGNETTCYICFGIREGGIDDEEEKICSGYGECVGENICQCDEGHFDLECEGTLCFDIMFNDSSVCGVHGDCIDVDTCDCLPYYNHTSTCGYKCFGELSTNTDDVCSGHGDCVDIDNCTCVSELYQGYKCHYFTCFDISVIDFDNVCGGNGVCIDRDTCLCQAGYSSSSFETPCDEWYCGQLYKDDEDVCTGRGTCVGSHQCDCNGGYEGSLCETWSCGFEYINPMTCSGNGDCISPDECICDSGFIGEKCEVNQMLYTVMAPVLTVSSGIFVAFLVLIFCLICCCIFCGVCVFYYFSCILCCCICSLRLRVKKFSKLKNFDILMEEQKMEEDTSIAHLKINKKFFEIPYDELKMEKVLGEGGSAAVVYKGKWKGSVIAFKCFKTRQICSNQDQFDEFERETEILSSVNHPNICQFLGCSLKPPRIGFCMEYCSNGDLVNFLQYYRMVEDEKNGYPVEERIRFCLEIVLAMDYLHSRSIIHRDLKLENVLVDSKYACKLMDFGLSKMISRMSQTKTRKIGTSMYMAPEIILCSKYDGMCDVFSFAIMMFVIFTENFFPYGADAYGIEIRVAGNPDLRPDIKELDNCGIPEDQSWIKETIVKCWNHDPGLRLNFQDLSDLFSQKREASEVLAQTKRTSEIQLSTSNNEKTEEKLKMKEEYIEILEEQNEFLGSEMAEMEREKKKYKETIKLLEDKVKELKKKKKSPPIPKKKGYFGFGRRKPPVIPDSRKKNNKKRKKKAPPRPPPKKKKKEEEENRENETELQNVLVSEMIKIDETNDADDKIEGNVLLEEIDERRD